MQSTTNSTFIGKENLTQFTTWFLTAFFYAFQMMLRVLPGIMAYDIMEHFSMSVTQFGILSAIYYLGYSAMQIPIGLMLDKLHPRFVISGCVLLCVLGTYCFIISDQVIFAYLGRLLIGVGSVAGILGAVKAIDDFYTNRYSLFLGFTIFIGVSGAYIANSPEFINLLKQQSMAQVLNLVAMVGMALAFLILLFYKQSHSEDKEVQALSIYDTFKVCVANRYLWVIGLLGGFMIGPLEGFADVWSIPYFEQIHHLTKADASFAATLIFIGFGIGGPLIGYIAEKVENLNNLLIFCGIGMLGCYVMLFAFDDLPKYIIYTNTFIIGALSAYQILVVTIGAKIAPKRMIAITTSMLNMLMMVFGTIFHSAIGYTISFFTPEMLGNVRVYTPEAYHTAFSVIIIGLIIGIIGFRYCKR